MQPFTFVDSLIVLAFFILFIAVSYFHKENQQLKGNTYYQNYIPTLLFKLMGSLAFGVIYLFILGYGGDTYAYYLGAESVAKLLWYNPSSFFQELFAPHQTANYHNFYSTQTGYPPIWLYISGRHFFLCKLTAIFYLISFGNFWGMTMIMGYFSFLANWKLYKIFIHYFPTLQKPLLYSTLWVPSIAIWCGGLMKDTVIFISICGMLYACFAYFTLKKISFFRFLILSFFFLLLIIKIKGYILFMVVPCILLWILYTFSQRITHRFLRVIAIPVLMVVFFSSAFLIYLNSGSALNEFSSEQIIEKALITQDDFSKNNLYTGKRYSIGEVENTPWGITKVLPASLLAGVFRPFIWEASNGVTILSGLECFVTLLLFLFALFRMQPSRMLAHLRSNPLVICSLLITLILGTISGFTAGLFGTLVRFRAPLLPFFISLLVLIIYLPKTHKS